jgi:predicted transcriptional regulator
MKQIMIQLDDATAAELEKIAPGKNRKRSQFLRAAIARVVHERLELATREAYEKWPDEAPPAEPSDWAAEDEAVRPPRRRARRTRVRQRAAR